MFSTNRSASSPFDVLSNHMILAVAVLSIAAIESSRSLAQPAAMAAFAEFATSSHRTDPVHQFLNMDLDLDGRLYRKELQALPAWGPAGFNWLDG